MSARGHFDLKWRTGAYLRPLGYDINGRLDTQVAQATPFWGTRLIAGYSLGRGTFPDYYERATLSAGEIRAGLVAEVQLELASARDVQVRTRAERGEIPPVEAIDNRRALLKRQATAVKARQELEQAATSLMGSAKRRCTGRTASFDGTISGGEG